MGVMFISPIALNIVLHHVDGEWRDEEGTHLAENQDHLAKNERDSIFSHFWHVGTAICAAFLSTALCMLLFNCLQAFYRGVLTQFVWSWWEDEEGNLLKVKAALICCCPLLALGTMEFDDNEALEDFNDFLESLCMATVFTEMSSALIDFSEVLYHGKVNEYFRQFALINSGLGHGIPEGTTTRATKKRFFTSKIAISWMVGFIPIIIFTGEKTATWGPLTAYWWYMEVACRVAIFMLLFGIAHDTVIVLNKVGCPGMRKYWKDVSGGPFEASLSSSLVPRVDVEGILAGDFDSMTPTNLASPTASDLGLDTYATAAVEMASLDPQSPGMDNADSEQNALAQGSLMGVNDTHAGKVESGPQLDFDSTESENALLTSRVVD